MNHYIIRTQREEKCLSELVVADSFAKAEMDFRLSHGSGWPILAIEEYPSAAPTSAETPDRTGQPAGSESGAAEIWMQEEEE